MCIWTCIDRLLMIIVDKPSQYLPIQPPARFLRRHSPGLQGADLEQWSPLVRPLWLWMGYTSQIGMHTFLIDIL